MKTVTLFAPFILLALLFCQTSALADSALIERDGKTYVKNAQGELVEVQVVKPAPDRSQLRAPARGGKFGRPHPATWLAKEDEKTAPEGALQHGPPPAAESGAPFPAIAAEEAQNMEYELRIWLHERGEAKTLVLATLKQGVDFTKNFDGRMEWGTVPNYDEHGNAIDGGVETKACALGTRLRITGVKIRVENGAVSAGFDCDMKRNRIVRPFELKGWKSEDGKDVYAKFQPVIHSREIKTPLQLHEGGVFKMPLSDDHLGAAPLGGSGEAFASFSFARKPQE